MTPVSPEITMSLESARSEGLELSTWLETVPLDSPEVVTLVSETAQAAHKKLKELDELEKSVTKPINTALKSVRDLFRPAKGVYEGLKDLAKGRLAEYHATQEKARRAAVAQAQVLITTDPGQARSAILSIPEPVKTGGVSARAVWVFRVTDPTLVPREYCTPSDAIIRAAVGAGVREIPGVEIREEMQTRLTGR